MNELTTRNNELAASASAAQAKAEIECAFAMAFRRRRNIEDVRADLMKACQRPAFAETAEYAKPIGNQKIKGPSIRFVETALQSLGNVRTATTITFEDERIRVIQVSVTDLENNNGYTLGATIEKTVERKFAKDRQVIATRENSKGEPVYVVVATEDEMSTKQGAIASKLIRTCGLRLIPKDIIDEAMDAARTTRQKSAGDPDAAKKKIFSAFSSLGIKPSEVEQFLGKPAAQILPADVDTLRAVYVAIKEGDATWADYMADADPAPKAKTLEEKLKAKQSEKPAEAEIVDGDPAEDLTREEYIASMGVSAKMLPAYLRGAGLDPAMEVGTLDDGEWPILLGHIQKIKGAKQ